MGFVEKMLFGEDLPKYSDQAIYPQTTFRKILCLRKHCDSECITGSVEDYKFWAYLLSLQSPDRKELVKYIYKMDDDLRTSVWNRLLRSSPSYQDSIGYDDNDKEIVRSIIDMCRNLNSNCSLEREVFCIYKNILRFCDVEQADKHIMSLIIHILRLPYADELVAFRALYFFLYTLGYIQAFLSESTKDIMCKLAFLDIMPVLLDVCICFNLYFSDFQVYIAENSLEDLNIRVQTKMEKILQFAVERYRPIEERSCNLASESYFDFLVIQNESIKAHEDMKTRLVNKIKQLEQSNRELGGKNQNLADNLETMEGELNIFNEKYVVELKNILENLRVRCEQLESENKQIKDKSTEKA